MQWPVATARCQLVDLSIAVGSNFPKLEKLVEAGQDGWLSKMRAGGSRWDGWHPASCFGAFPVRRTAGVRLKGGDIGDYGWVAPRIGRSRTPPRGQERLECRGIVGGMYSGSCGEMGKRFTLFAMVTLQGSIA